MSESSEPPDEVREAMGATPEPSVEHRRVLISLFDLSARQRRTIAAALTLLAAVALGWICIKLGGGVIGFVGRFSSVFLPLVTAFILSMMIKPYFEWLHRQSDKITPAIAVGIVYFTFIIPLAILLFFFGSFLFKQTTELVTDFPGIMQRAQANVSAVIENNDDLKAFWEKHNLSSRAEALAKERAEEIMGVTGDFFRKVLRVGSGAFTRAAGLLGWFVLPVYLGFFLMMRPINRSERHEWFSFLKHETREDIIYLIDQFVEIIVSFFRGQLVIALIQATLFGVGFQLIGLRFGFVIGFALGLLNVIPYLGSMVGLAVALPTAFFQGENWHGMEGGLMLVLLVLLVFMVVQSIEGYLLTPRIMGDRTGLHPMAIIVAIFFWGTAFDGIIGMILAIPLTAFLVVFWRLAKRKELLQGWF